MTQPGESDSSKREIGLRFFKGRRLAPLVGPWISSAIFAALAYYVGRTIPALREVTSLMYAILVVIVVISTGRWLRARSGDRRAGERRTTRRPDLDPPP